MSFLSDSFELDFEMADEGGNVVPDGCVVYHVKSSKLGAISLDKQYDTLRCNFLDPSVVTHIKYKKLHSNAEIRLPECYDTNGTKKSLIKLYQEDHSSFPSFSHESLRECEGLIGL